MKVTEAWLKLTGLTRRTLELHPAPVTRGVRRREKSTKGCLQARPHGSSTTVAVFGAAGIDGEKVGAELRLVEGGGKRVLKGVVSRSSRVSCTVRLAGVRLEGEKRPGEEGGQT